MKKLAIFIMLQGVLWANSCPKWAPIVMDDIVTIISVYNGSSNTKPDRDCDGLSDEQEAAMGTNPNKRDTDGDGTDDYNDDYPLNPNKSKDTTPPSLTLKGSNPMVIYRYIPYKEAGAVATDDRDGSVAVQIRGNVNTHVPNTYTVLYAARDAKGNRVTKSRMVIVKAEIRPQLTLDSSSAVDASGTKAAQAVKEFIDAFVADDETRVSELVGGNERLLNLLYNNPDATTFLKQIYKNTYLIKEKAYALGEVDVSITFRDAGASHQGGFELIRTFNEDGENVWIIRKLY